MKKRVNYKKKIVLQEPQPTVKKIAVIIDSRTTIYVKEGTDPEVAREKFLSLHKK